MNMDLWLAVQIYNPLLKGLYKETPASKFEHRSQMQLRQW